MSAAVPTVTAPSSVRLAAARAEAFAAFEARRAWFVDEVLPLWGTTGVDFQNGGFFEKIDRDLAAIEEPRRTRVVGRQLFVFANAARLGWQGPARALVFHGLEWFRHACLGPDGTAIRTARRGGAPEDVDFELYDQAFALFGLAAAYGETGSEDLPALARGIRDGAKAGWGHPVAGFEAARPRRLPLEANPHMHMFEAAVAWEKVAPAEDRADWAKLADEIGDLALSRFIDPTTGALREFFDGDWRPIAGEQGRIVEPGHQFEWGWLLDGWARSRGRADAIAAARRLIAVGEDHGVDRTRNVAIAELFDDFTVRDAATRVWPQTERMKAWAAVAASAGGADERADALERLAAATRSLELFVDRDHAGLWFERMRADGTFRDEPPPASTLYHVACALLEVDALFRRI